MTFRIINTAEAHTSPRGIPYIHDAARPFAVLFDKGRGEVCALRCPTIHAAEVAVIRFSLARARYSTRNAQVA